MRGSVLLGTTDRRDLLEMQAELDRQVFDSSLGCPLSSFDHATLALVGGKALQCWRLTKHGFPVPTAFVIPTYVYSLHIGEAGVVELIQDVFSSNLKDDTTRQAAKTKLDTIRERILQTPLNAQVVSNLEAFLASLPPATPVAVRSSGSAEDLATQSFAGQYDTFLYKITKTEICDSVKACWASMFQHHIFDYASRSDEPMKAPKMGVLIMKMVEAKASGVCFTQNLWGDKKEIMVEAVLGQGEGLVSGDLTPDRYVLDKYSTRLCYQELNEQTQMYAKANNEDGVEKITLDKPHEGPVLVEKDLKALTRLARGVETFYNRPQDIEWAIDKSGGLYLLQARPITTLGDVKSLSFLPPGEGFFTFDPTHFPRPLSPWMQKVYSFDYATERSRRTGCLIKTIKLRFVHGYAFSQPELFAPSDALERAGEAYWSKKLYEDDYREFTDFFRPDCEALQEELRVVNPSALSHSSLVQHVAKCFDFAAEFWKLHHTYSMPTMAVVGDYMNRMSALTGKGIMETLTLLECASPESRGILNQQDPLLGKMYCLLRRSDQAQKLLKCEESGASWALDCLLHLPDELGETMRQVAIQYGWRLAGGYDLVVPALVESPNFFLKTILQGVEEDEDAAEIGEERVLATVAQWKSALPSEKHAEFEEILDVGRRFFRIRDERGLATDLSGVGLCRRGILEAGRRLVDQGVINMPEHLTVALKHEALALLTGDLAILRETNEEGPIDVPTAQVLEHRFDYIKTADPSLVPRALGTPPPPPPDIPLPPNIGRSMGAMEGGFKGIWDEGSHTDEDITNNPNKVKGLPASMGKVTAPVCLILQDDDLQKVKKGDIIVTYSSSASFNIVLGLCAGICTDFGGMLSHAAIVAREYGIPAVVGTQLATKKFKSGDIVCIDSSTSTVTRVEES